MLIKNKNSNVKNKYPIVGSEAFLRFKQSSIKVCRTSSDVKSESRFYIGK